MSSIFDPATLILSITQDGRPIEFYVEEFLQLAHQVPWNDGTLKAVFWSGLDDQLFLQAPAATTPGSLAQYIDHVLLLAGSSFIVGEVDENASITQLLPSQHTPARLVPAVYSIKPTPVPRSTPVCEIFKPFWQRRHGSESGGSCGYFSLEGPEEISPSRAPLSKISSSHYLPVWIPSRHGCRTWAFIQNGHRTWDLIQNGCRTCAPGSTGGIWWDVLEPRYGSCPRTQSRFDFHSRVQSNEDYRSKMLSRVRCRMLSRAQPGAHSHHRVQPGAQFSFIAAGPVQPSSVSRVSFVSAGPVQPSFISWVSTGPSQLLCISWVPWNVRPKLLHQPAPLLQSALQCPLLQNPSWPVGP